MNRNVESHFAELPAASIERSIFDRSASHKTSFNVGDLIPFFWDEVLPGDTFNVMTSVVARLQTLLTPIMDNVYLDTYYFFVPCRILWTHWKEFMGENSDSAWIPQVNYSMPKISSPDNGWNVGSIADYLGVPTGVEFKAKSDTSDGLMPDALPFRAYALIADQWFRDQNVTDPLNIPLGDSNQSGSNGSSYINDVANGGAPFKAAKYHDYFTSCLPNAQKAAPVTFGANPTVTASGLLPVVTGDARTWIDTVPNLTMKLTNGHGIEGTGSTHYPLVYSYQASDVGMKINNTVAAASNINTAVVPDNLWADSASTVISASGVSFTINELRLAFQLQKFYEKQARAGSRYREIILEMFNVHSPDGRMMVPEYLGGTRIPIQIHQIANTAQGESDFLGDLGGMSNTADIHEDFIKSFTEHGYVFGLCCVRYDHSYPQGLNKSFVHDSYLDYYWPVFANIGEQPVYKYEIDASIRENEDRMSVFGYQEAWANYRYKPARVSGEMRPGILNSLASWHLSDYYTAQPSLSDGWIREDKANVDRVLAVTSAVSNQVFCDFFVKNIVTRAMPMYSVPGLIDHH